MAGETFLQYWLVSDFILPFFLIWFIAFAILEKTKLLGDGRHQLNTLIAAVLGLIFVSSVFPKQVVGNLILFLTVAIVVVFVGLLLWGFATGGEAKIPDGVKVLGAIAIVIAVGIAVLWAVGLRVEFFNNLFDFLFNSSWSTAFWTNVSFIVVIAIAAALLWVGSKARA